MIPKGPNCGTLNDLFDSVQLTFLPLQYHMILPMKSCSKSLHEPASKQLCAQNHCSWGDRACRISTPKAGVYILTNSRPLLLCCILYLHSLRAFCSLLLSSILVLPCPRPVFCVPCPVSCVPCLGSLDFLRAGATLSRRILGEPSEANHIAFSAKLNKNPCR